MDDDTPLITTSKIAGAMNYPSTTQALFALIVMIIVLLFILVYCCWGTFSCARQEEATNNAEDGAAVVREIQGPGGRGNRMVIVPFSNMIYVGDPESRRIYEIPVEQDKPPAYTEVYDGMPPPPYSTDSQGRETPVNANSNNASNTRRPLRDFPPSYEDCFSATTTNNKWPELLEALMSEQAKQELEQSSRQQSGEMLVTQLPALRMPSMLMVQNEMLSNREISPFTIDVPAPSESNVHPSTESERASIPAASNQTESEQNPSSSVVTNLLDPWVPPPPFEAPPAWSQNEEGDPVAASFQQAFTVSPTVNQISTEEEDSLSNATEEDSTPSPATSSTSDSLNLNENQESNTTQSHQENSHSTQDDSKV